MSHMRPCLVALVLIVALPSARADVGEEVAPPPDTIVATTGLGPAATIAAACALEPMDANDNADTFCSIETTSKDARKVKKLKRVAPYQDLALVSRDSDDPAGMRLAIKTADQWYVVWLATWSNDGAHHGDFAMTSIRIKDVIPGGAPEILITGSHDDLGESHSYVTYGSRTEALWVCSLGASGAPGCAEVYLGEQWWPHEYSSSKKWKFRLSYKFDKQGRVVRKLKGKFPRDRRRDEGEVISELPPRSDFVNTRSLLFR